LKSFIGIGYIPRFFLFNAAKQHDEMGMKKYAGDLPQDHVQRANEYGD
jgi:hypothetical protein